MKLHRRAAAAVVVVAAATLAAPLAQAQAKKDSATIGMVLEPPGLDPTIAPSAAIGEIVHYNIFEGLTKINADGSITPLLAESWTHGPGRQELHLQAAQGRQVPGRRGVRLVGGQVQLRARQGPKSTNKAKGAVFDNISSISAPDPHTVILTLNNADGNFLFRMGENTAVILHPKSAANAATKPVGTGPLQVRRLEEGRLGHADQVGRLSRCQVDQAQAR